MFYLRLIGLATYTICNYGMQNYNLQLTAAQLWTIRKHMTLDQISFKHQNQFIAKFKILSISHSHEM